MFDIITLGKNIKKYRKRLNMTQTELSDKLNVTCQSVSKWESGISAPGIDNLCLLSKIFNTSVDEIVGNKTNHNKVMIGIDGGGSKTEFVMFNDNWDILDHIILGACNPNSVGIKESANLIKSGIYSMLSTYSDVSGIYIGSSGFGSGGNGEKVVSILKSEFPGIKIKYSTDSLNVIASATDKDRCVSVICGTGSVIYVKEKDKYTRLTGWGYLLSKSGSGYDIGKDAVYASLKDYEGLGDKTILTSYVIDKIGGPVMENIDKIYKSDQSYLASFAPYVIEGYYKKDKVSIDILKSNAKSISDIINYAFNNFDCGNDVILSGSLFTTNDIFPDLVKENLNKKINVIISENPQVYGACILCAKALGVKTDKSKRFLEQYEKMKNGDKKDA